MEKRKIDIPQRLTQNMLTPQEECLEIPQKKSKLFIGIPKENSFQENRVALSPAAVKTLINAGHKVVVEEDAGSESGFLDFEYSEAGAEIAYSSEQVFKAHVIIKVAPPSLEEIDLCHPGQIIISPIHLPSLSEEYIYRLKKKRVTALAMEYMKDQSGIFPFVRIMSEMAGISAIADINNRMNEQMQNTVYRNNGMTGVLEHFDGRGDSSLGAG
ncbi:MAG: alanine dehydrogenase, partial [Aureispira sp.]|nr:alanine dehydrogenase [Aureispira sp.]